MELLKPGTVYIWKRPVPSGGYSVWMSDDDLHGQFLRLSDFSPITILSLNVENLRMKVLTGTGQTIYIVAHTLITNMGIEGNGWVEV